MNTPRFFSLSVMAVLLYWSGHLFAAVTVDPQGWTNITPSGDSRLIYVSSSEGNDDSNDGSIGAPMRTIAAAADLIRDGYPDHLLLKRGDVFTPEGRALGQGKSGRSPTEPLVISYYGESGPRPVIKLDTVLMTTSGRDRSYISFIGLDFYGAYSDPNSPEFNGSDAVNALILVGGGDSIHIEDCRFRFTSVHVDSYLGENNELGEYSNFTFRRNIVTDNWKEDSSLREDNHISGLHLAGVRGYTIEENFFDHNGWNEQLAEEAYAGPSIYSHNLYLHHDNLAGGVIRGNISVRGASHGINALSGGTIERNLLAFNAVGIGSGGGNDAPTDPNVHAFPNRAMQNVVLNGRRIENSNHQTPAVWGIEGGYFHTSVEDNVVANRLDDGTNYAYHPHNGGTFGMADNISYQWDPRYDETDPSWSSPDDDLGDYYASIGGSNSSEDYFNWLRERPLRTMDWNMTAYAPINFIRAGFNKPAVSGYWEYPGDTGSGGEPNVALGASVTASAWQDDELGRNPPEFLVDGDTSVEPNARWSAEFFPQHVILDLGSQYTIDQFRLYPLDERDYQYTIEVSDDGVDYSLVVDRSDNTEGAPVLVDTISAIDARYVKLAVTGAATYSGDWISIGEFEVYGEPHVVPPDRQNLAQDSDVTASAWQDDGIGYNPPESLVDGNISAQDGARWSAESFPQHAVIDLGDVHAIEEFRLYPHQGRDYQYTIAVSDDGANYTTVVDRTSNTEGSSVLIDLVSATNARYVKLTVTGAASYSGDWVSIAELEVYAEGSVAPSPGYNFAQGAEVTASASQDDEWGYNPPESLVDGDASAQDGARWSAEFFPQHAVINLGALIEINEFRLYPLHGRDYQYTIEVSDDGENYTTVVDRTSNTEEGWVLVDPVTATNARFVKLTVTGAATYSGDWVSIAELEVYGEVAQRDQNLALGADITASAWQDDEWGHNPPSALADGETSAQDGGRWSAMFFPQHAVLDLGETYTIEHFRLFPLYSRDYQYTIEVSEDGESYTTVVDRSSNTEDDAIFFDAIAATKARYVKLTVTGASTYSGDWVSIAELEVYGW